METNLSIARTNGTLLELVAENVGDGSSHPADDSFVIDLSVPSGAIKNGRALRGFREIETLCSAAPYGPLQPCSLRRANVVRLKASSWRPGDKYGIVLEVDEGIPDALAAIVAIRRDNENIEKFEKAIAITERGSDVH